MSGSLSAEGLQQFIANVVANYDVDPRQITIIGYSAGSGSVTSTAVNKGDLIKSGIVIEGGFRFSVPDDHTLKGPRPASPGSSNAPNVSRPKEYFGRERLPKIRGEHRSHQTQTRSCEVDFRKHD